MAELEAAAVAAFRRLHQELAGLGAPREILARVRDATRDEIRHTRATRVLAGRDSKATTRGAERRLWKRKKRDVLSIAVENAREGCVRETYGALVAWHQAVHAADPEVRATMLAIADEETGHAALSIDIAAWLDQHLSTSERHRVDEERKAALLELNDELAAGVSPSLVTRIGLPSATRAREMLGEVGAALSVGLAAA
jgi:hypothetical protein